GCFATETNYYHNVKLVALKAYIGSPKMAEDSLPVALCPSVLGVYTELRHIVTFCTRVKMLLCAAAEYKS
ncbi:MAG: hypothetical protein KDE53_06845, partial [Caldilineaceae bacterium]|nr:hypothetical protein [Caldilineaceae bacterium]